MKVAITYVGETGSNVWGGVDLLPAVTFEKNVALEIDTSKVPGNHKGFYEHLIKTARTNRFFEVVDVKSKDKGSDVDKKPPTKKRPAKARA